MNQNTLDIYAKIMADAQAKAEAQAKGTRVTAAPKKLTEAKITPVQVPVQPKPIQATAVRVVTKDNLIRRYQSFAVPELSTMTSADLLGEVEPQTTADLRIVQYSDKCVVVVGNTKANKDRLKAIGGKYNKWLKCGEGWVFPKSKEALIKAEFSL
jgi:hypothetical protein